MKRIALGMNLFDYYDHGIARGIVRYAKTHTDWELYGYGWMFSHLQELRTWDGDGVIVRAEYRESVADLRNLVCPVVDVANAFPSDWIYTVCNDDSLTGLTAARHMRSNGHRRFAYCGVDDVAWSRERFSGFQDGVFPSSSTDEDGRTAPAPPADERIPMFERPLAWWLRDADRDDLTAFITRLPRPTAVFAANDKIGLRVSAVCRALGISVPEEIAILGVDNEDIPCELANPSLSSVELQLERIGRQAAFTMDRLLRGETPVHRVAVPPATVVQRTSTAAYTSSDPLIVEAFRLIRGDRGHTHTVATLAHALAVSRRTLENHFKRQCVGTIHDALTAQRMTVATHLLSTTDRTVEAIAADAGFGSLPRFYAQFKRTFGITPAQYRKHDHLHHRDDAPRAGTRAFSSVWEESR